jgi:succinate dehydrogenase/fumarate reductase flavoprotein subunit
MWDPFRYKLGGHLLNSNFEAFEDGYASTDARSDGTYVLTRDQATYAITKEVEAGRGSPAGGAYLSFQHIPDSELRRAFGPIIDRLAANGIDLTRQPVEVAPIAHYHMGGVRVSPNLETNVAGLFACGEAIGGANGANRLSGNALTEAFVFGANAGKSAARAAKGLGHAWSGKAANPTVELLRSARPVDGPNLAREVVDLQAIMADKVGPFRTDEKLRAALARLEQMTIELGEVPRASIGGFDTVLLDWLDLRNMLMVARSVATPALARTESRGAHQREDYPSLLDHWTFNQVLALKGDTLTIERSVPFSSRGAA